MKTVRRPPYPKWNPGYFPCSSLTPLPLSSRRPSVSFGGFGLTLDVVVASTTPDGAALVNTVVAESAQIDVDLSDNTATTTSTVEVLKVDLEITKQADVDPVVAGEQLTYTITVTNSALTPATGVRVVEALPPQVSFVSGVTSQGDYDSDTQVWTIGDLGSGQDAQLSLEVLVASTTPDGAALVKSASVTSDQVDLDPSDNTTTTSTNVKVVQVDVEVTKQSSLGSVSPNPPKDTDGRREESGRGVRELQGK